MNTVFLDVDTQIDFLYPAGALYVPGAEAIVPVVAKLNREVTRILGLPDVKERLLALGAEPTPTTPEQFDTHVRSEIAKFRKIIQDANIKVD